VFIEEVENPFDTRFDSLNIVTHVDPVKTLLCSLNSDSLHIDCWTKASEEISRWI